MVVVNLVFFMYWNSLVLLRICFVSFYGFERFLSLLCFIHVLFYLLTIYMGLCVCVCLLDVLETKVFLEGLYDYFRFFLFGFLIKVSYTYIHTQKNIEIQYDIFFSLCTFNSFKISGLFFWLLVSLESFYLIRFLE